MNASEERALLEAAARAGGYPGKLKGWTWHPDKPRGFEYQQGDRLLIWNSRTNDGDAFRLAVKLDLLTDSGLTGSLMAASMAPDPLAATRLAITRAAAQMDPEKT